MATYTSNLNLKKPALDDDALITDINNNMDILDAAANGIEDALAIVANGNTHAAITSGQFVYVRNHNTLTEGLYVASSNIAANATLSSSNLAADSKGGLNALSEQIAYRNNLGTTEILSTETSKDISVPNSGNYKFIQLIFEIGGITNAIFLENKYLGSITAFVGQPWSTYGCDFRVTIDTDYNRVRVTYINRSTEWSDEKLYVTPVCFKV